MVTTLKRPVRAHRTPSQQEPSKFRPDIEGLRAVAVVLVVVDHLAGWPRGGFIGVDVFFVISGFLITGLLLDETAKRGQLSFVNFYKRRARRILPAAFTILIACFVAAHLVFRGARIRDTMTDILWALGFSANTHFADIGTDYFQANRPVSLVQHFWSLAVEEQFYVVWPVVIFTVMSIIGRKLTTSSTRTLLLALLVTAMVASFVYAKHQTQSDPTAAYFSTLARAWELGVGAVLAVAVHRFPSIGNRIGAARGAIVGVGLLGIFLGAFIITANSAFPAPAAALPVIATALIIAGGAAGGPGRWGYVLTNPASRYIGRVSFSLYLWHWPVIVICQAVLPQRSTTFYVTALLAMCGFTVVSYHFIEAPFRQPFRGWAYYGRRQRKARRGQISGPPAFITPAVIASALLVGVLMAWTLRPQPAVAITSLTTTPPTTTAAAAPNVAQPSAALATAIASAVSATTWPTFDPSLDSLGPTAAVRQWNGCLDVEHHLSDCTYLPDPRPAVPKVAVVMGDSISMAWLPAIRKALSPKGWTVYGLVHVECPAAYVRAHGGPTESIAQTSSACESFHTWMVREVKQLEPTLVMLSSSDNTLSRMDSKAVGAAAALEYQAGMVKTENLVKAPGRRVITLSPPPGAANLQACDTATATPTTCLMNIAPRWNLQSVADATAAEQTQTEYIDTKLWFCSTFNTCPSFVGTTPLFWDGAHMTEKYSQSLGPELAAALKV